MGLRESLVNAIRGVNSAQERLAEQGARDRSQIGLLTAQVVDLKEVMAV